MDTLKYAPAALLEGMLGLWNLRCEMGAAPSLDMQLRLNQQVGQVVRLGMPVLRKQDWGKGGTQRRSQLPHVGQVYAVLVSLSAADWHASANACWCVATTGP
jgi:hypothetical protein